MFMTLRTLPAFKICNPILHSYRRFCTNSPIMEKTKIGTHDGIFHCDEVLACYLLKQIPEYSNAEIVRSRNPNVLSECNIVVDVGGVFNKSSHRYDHHQADFKETFSSLRPTSKQFNTRLSSAGLIYVHFGEQIIRNKVNLEDSVVKVIYEKIYENLIEEIDAIDNGITISDGKLLYKITTDLSSQVRRLNPQWNAPEGYDVKESFEEAMDLVGNEFLDRIKYYSTSWWPARAIVSRAIEGRFQVHPSGEIIQLETVAPWSEHLLDIEESQNIKGSIKFCLFPDGKNSKWRVQCMPISPGSFICRNFLKKEWWGVRDENLSKAAGIPGCIFCHATGFIGGNETLEGALQMAAQSLESNQS